MNQRVLALQTACDKPGCPALACSAVCSVHHPSKIVERVKAIVSGNFDRVTGLGSAELQILKKLHADIVRDLESTV